MMTRKDYIETAKILAEFREISLGQDDLDELIFDDLVNSFSKMFIRDNPRFDTLRFESACWGYN